MPGPLSKEQIKTVLSEIWRARELGEEYAEDMAFLAQQTQYPDLEAYLEEALFQGDLPIEQVAVRLAAFEPVKRQLVREELIEAVRRIMTVEGDAGELEELLDVVQANVPHPDVADLIYWPPEGKDLSPEEVVDRALAYRPGAEP
jgi:hypothetical protein